MFVAKLIEQRESSQAKKPYVFLIVSLILLVIAALCLYLQQSIYLVGALGVLSLAAILIHFRKPKKHSDVTISYPQRQIIIEKDRIRIISGYGTIDQEISVRDVDRIELRDPYSDTFDNLKSRYGILHEADTRNSLILNKGNESIQFDFEVDSLHTINQLKKEILFWKSIGHRIYSKGSIIDIQ